MQLYKNVFDCFVALARRQIMELFGGNFYKVLIRLTDSPYKEVQYNCAGVIGHLAINGNNPFTHSLTHSLIIYTHSLAHSLTPSLTHSYTHSLMHSLTPSHSPTHPLTHSPTHSLTHSLTLCRGVPCPFA